MSEIKAAGIENLGMVTEPEGQDAAAPLAEETETAK
jgi:hypothetical protein